MSRPDQRAIEEVAKIILSRYVSRGRAAGAIFAYINDSYSGLFWLKYHVVFKGTTRTARFIFTWTAGDEKGQTNINVSVDVPAPAQSAA